MVFLLPAWVGTGDTLFNCDRQCRWYHGFFDRSINGQKLKAEDLMCACFRSNVSIGTAPYHTTDHPVTGPPTVPDGFQIFDRECCKQGDDIPWGDCTEPTGKCHANVYSNAKLFDSAYWADTYRTSWLCARNTTQAIDAPPHSLVMSSRMHTACMVEGNASADHVCRESKRELEASGLEVLHCGKCSACSSPHDLEVLNKTRNTITSEMTACSVKWVILQKTFHPPPLDALKECLTEKGIDFSNDGRAWADPVNKPTCMDVWTDNILNDASLCTSFCLTKFLRTQNTGNFAKDQCLQVACTMEYQSLLATKHITHYLQFNTHCTLLLTPYSTVRTLHSALCTLHSPLRTPHFSPVR